MRVQGMHKYHPGASHGQCWNMYTVAAASRMSGVPAETLRAWERRYRIITPRRDARGHRVYDATDVDRLRLLRRATELGHPISRLAALDPDSLRRTVEECPADVVTGAGASGNLVDRLLDAATRFRADECDEVLGCAATLLDPDTLTRDVVVPAMRAAGEAWHRGELCTAQERLLTGSARRTLGALISSYRRRGTGPAVVLAGLPGEQHEVGLLVTALLAASRGMDCVYLGPDIPIDDMVRAAQATEARCLGVSCVTRMATCDLCASVEDLCQRLPDGCELWVGGCSAHSLDKASLPACCICLDSHDALCEQLERLAAA